jgi:TRAP-type mannitol/chloroaromatic compound transport system substrate-binding protein
MKELKKLAADVVREESEKSPIAKKVYASYEKFRKRIGDWAEVSEAAYHNLIRG